MKNLTVIKLYDYYPADVALYLINLDLFFRLG